MRSSAAASITGSAIRTRSARWRSCSAKAPRAPESLTRELVAFVQRLRKQDLFKSPGVAETLDWASALTELDAVALDPAQVSDTLGVLLKYQDDIAKIEGATAQTLIDEARAELRRSELG